MGGAIAVGHPLASSGIRLMSNLARDFAVTPQARYGITTMCIGLGMGGTVIWSESRTGPDDRNHFFSRLRRISR
jgi:acetyl-CoA acyltransferase